MLSSVADINVCFQVRHNIDYTKFLKKILFIIEQYVQEIKKSLNYKRLSNLIYSIGFQLNDNKSKFDKSDIIEQAIQIYSDGRFTAVDEDGKDHKDRDYPHISFEVKFTSKGKG